MSEEERLVVIRFGRDWDADCMRQDEVLYRIADRVKNFAVLYVCDLDQVPDFKQMYELYDPVTLMFFFRNKHMVCKSCCLGTFYFPLRKEMMMLMVCVYDIDVRFRDGK